jgi:hypothetical protein
LSEQGFPAGVVREFAALFVPRRGHFGEHTEGGWLKRYEELTDALIAEHLRGERTFGVYPGHKEAGFVALECDFGEEEATPANVLELSARIMGKEGFRAWEAVRDAGEELGIAPLYWCVDYTGGRSLHFELIPEAPVPYRDAHRIAKALGELVRRAGQAVCTVYPTNRTGDGKLLRLPCGRHRKTGVHGCFVEPGLRELIPRPAFRNDTGYLKLIARVPGDVLTDAATLAAAVVQEAPQAQAEPQEVAQVAHDPRPAQGGRFTQTDPALAQRIGRPCILWLIEHGVPEGHRHDVALLLRTELKACGFTPEEALPVYRRFARACTPPWAPEEADRDLWANWADATDTKKRHLCRTKGASSLTGYLQDQACVGPEACAQERPWAFNALWAGQGLSANARVLYMALCKLEVDFWRRPGEEVHTTEAQLTAAADLSVRTFRNARAELEAHGLIGHKASSRGKAKGVHSLYWRAYPVPLPGQGTPQPKTARRRVAQEAS